MRILCAHASASDRLGLRPETREALDIHAQGHDIEYVDCTGKETRYHDTLERYWQAAADWLNVEQDVIIDERVLPELEACPEPWCVFLTELACGYTPGAMGCVRFRTALMRALPAAMHEAGLADSSGVVARAWYRTDVRLDQILRNAGHTPHLHGRVRHLNERQRLQDPESDWRELLERLGRLDLVEA